MKERLDVILVEQGMIQDFLMNDKCSAGTAVKCKTVE